MSPIIIPDFKLVFFTIPKVGCTVWKQLFRRMMGLKDWTTHSEETKLPHNPNANGLRYLYDYPIVEANIMMTSPNWTRAMFVRDPKERFISAFLDKGQNKDFIRKACCWENSGCENMAARDPEHFLKVARKCKNGHWDPQSNRMMEDKYWPYLNFIGHFDNLHQDARRLLQRIGAWDGLGDRGWGTFRNESIFQPKSTSGRIHATNAHDKLKEYISTAELEDQLEQYYLNDYYNSILNLTMTRIHLPARAWD